MKLEMKVYRNIDLNEDGDFEVRFVEVDPDEDGKVEKVVYHGIHTTYDDGEKETTAKLEVFLDDEIVVTGLIADEIMAIASPYWKSWYVWEA